MQFSNMFKATWRFPVPQALILLGITSAAGILPEVAAGEDYFAKQTRMQNEYNRTDSLYRLDMAQWGVKFLSKYGNITPAGLQQSIDILDDQVGAIDSPHTLILPKGWHRVVTPNNTHWLIKAPNGGLGIKIVHMVKKTDAPMKRLTSAFNNLARTKLLGTPEQPDPYKRGDAWIISGTARAKFPNEPQMLVSYFLIEWGSGFDEFYYSADDDGHTFETNLGVAHALMNSWFTRRSQTSAMRRELAELVALR